MHNWLKIRNGIDSGNFQNFSRFFSLVLCTRQVYLRVYLPQFEITFELFFSSRYQLYVYILSFTTVYFETTFSFILKQIACAERMKLNDSVTISSKSIAGPEINYEYEFPRSKPISRIRQSLRYYRNTFSPSINYHRYPHRV